MTQCQSIANEILFEHSNAFVLMKELILIPNRVALAY